MISAPLLILFAVELYFAIGIAAFGMAERYDINGDTTILIYGWLPVALVVAIGALSLMAAVDGMNEVAAGDDDDRAQMGPSPIWIPGLLTLLVIVAIVLNELFLGIVPARGPLAAEYAHDPTSQFVLLTVAVATVALTKLVGWYRRRRSADG